MNLHLTPAERAFQGEISEFIAQHHVAGSGYPAETHRWHAAVISAGWTAPEWPTEYGGPGWSRMEIHLWYAATIAAGCPPPDYFALQVVGPLSFAQPGELSRDIAAGIVRRECLWANAVFPGIDEPVTARRAADGFVLMGRCPLVSFHSRTDAILVLAQAEAGETLFMLKTPRVTDSAGIQVLNLDAVRVPENCQLGQTGKAMAILESVMDQQQLTLARLHYSFANVKKLAKRLNILEEFSSDLAGLEITMNALSVTSLRLEQSDKRSTLTVMARRIAFDLESLRRNVLGYYALPAPPAGKGGNETAFMQFDSGQDVVQNDPLAGLPTGYFEDRLAVKLLGL